MVTVVWYMAQCLDCGGGLGRKSSQPFVDEAKRDGWVILHQKYTGHGVARWEEDARRMIVSHVRTGAVV
jgi:hypothetical protein